MASKKEQLGIMGGTFNPIHHGHLIAARSAREALGLDRLLLLPNARSPLRMEEALADPEDRLAMVQLAVVEESGLEACDLEVRREGASFLVETLAELQGVYPEAELTFLMGVDSLDTFDRWREVDRIVDLAQVKVMPRPGRDAEEALLALEARAPSLAGKVSLMTAGPQVEISATEVRERVAARKSIRYLLPDAVMTYIDVHQIFSS
ncbi:nicotinate-nucleotide adenylyltransferase [Kiritimatiellaeota bacterium B1221]|nr:nicotinate-nucleotide adenylyltransferase [Kiritimatiellaeota bacterium B1221]